MNKVRILLIDTYSFMMYNPQRRGEKGTHTHLAVSEVFQAFGSLPGEGW